MAGSRPGGRPPPDSAARRRTSANLSARRGVSWCVMTRIRGEAPPGDELSAWLEDGYAAAYRAAYAILRNRHDAEEAVQDAYLRAWRFRSSIPNGPASRPWLYRVVVNSCFSKLRADRDGRHRAPAVVGATGPDDPRWGGSPAVEQPESVAEANELRGGGGGAHAERP